MINIAYFIGAFCIGILYVYLITPPPEVVLKFPSPYNAGMITYKDKANNCYQYKAEKQDTCPADKALVKPQPIIEDFDKQMPMMPDNSDLYSSNYYLL